MILRGASAGKGLVQGDKTTQKGPLNSKTASRQEVAYNWRCASIGDVAIATVAG